jgi:DNA-binding protein HU-beta
MINNYTKKDLISDISGAYQNVSKTDVANIIDIAGKFLINRVKNGDKINFVGSFNAFAKKVAARKGRNPKTGAILDIPAHNKVCVKISPKLNEEMQ